MRAENEYLKTCKPWFWKTSDAGAETAGSSKAEAKTHTGYSSFNRSTSPSNFYYHLKRMTHVDEYEATKREITAIYHENKGRYGYCRITAELRNRKHLLNLRPWQAKRERPVFPVELRPP